MVDEQKLGYNNNKVENYLINNMYIQVFYNQKLNIQPLCEVTQQKFEFNQQHFFKFKHSLCAEIADLMIFHQIFGCKKQIHINQKSVDIESGQIIQAIRFNWLLPLNQDIYIEYLKYSLYSQEVLTDNYLRSDKSQLQWRVVIDKQTLHLLQPHFAIGNISVCIGKTLRNMTKNVTINNFDISYRTICHEQSSYYPSNLSTDYNMSMMIQFYPIMLKLIYYQQDQYFQSNSYNKQRDSKYDFRQEVQKGLEVMLMSMQPIISSLEMDDSKRNFQFMNIDALSVPQKKDNLHPIIEWVHSVIAAYYE